MNSTWKCPTMIDNVLIANAGKERTSGCKNALKLCFWENGTHLDRGIFPKLHFNGMLARRFQLSPLSATPFQNNGWPIEDRKWTISYSCRLGWFLFRGR